MSADRELMLRLAALGNRVNKIAQEAYAIDEEIGALLQEAMGADQPDEFWTAFFAEAAHA